MVGRSAMEVLGYGLRVTPRDDGQTRIWATFPPPGTNFPRMLNIAFLAGGTIKWATIFLATGVGQRPREITIAPLGGRGAHAVLNGAHTIGEIAHIEQDANDGPWWLRAHLSSTRSIDLPWLPLYFVESTPPGAETPLELRGPIRNLAPLYGNTGLEAIFSALDTAPPNGLVIVRGPIPNGTFTPDAMLEQQRAAGHTLVDRGVAQGAAWVETAFAGDHGPTNQRNYFRDVGAGEACLVTGQSPSDYTKTMRDYAEVIATTLAPR